MSHPDDLIAVPDANVLYPEWLRDVMLTLAAMGYYKPRWSQQIIDEMRRNVLADHPSIDARRFDDTTITALRDAFPDAWIEPRDELITTMDNEPGDRHVPAAAVAAEESPPSPTSSTSWHVTGPSSLSPSAPESDCSRFRRRPTLINA